MKPESTPWQGRLPSQGSQDDAAFHPLQEAEDEGTPACAKARKLRCDRYEELQVSQLREGRAVSEKTPGRERKNKDKNMRTVEKEKASEAAQW